MITAQKLQRAEVWDKPQCAAGSRKAILATLSRLQGTAQVNGDNVLDGTIALQDGAVPEVLTHRILRVDDGTNFDEWVISTVKKNSITGVVSFSGLPLANLMGGKAVVSQTDGSGVTRYDFELVGLLPSQIIDTYVLPALSAAGITWVARGTIDQDVVTDLTLSWDTPLSVMKTLADRLGLEFQFRRNGTSGYYLDLVTAIGSAAGVIDVRFGKNLLNHEQQKSIEQQVTRVLPRGMDQGGYRATMARAVWKISALASSVTNAALYSRDLTNAAWGDTAVVTRNQVGPDGVANKATTVNDNSAAAYLLKSQSWTVGNDNNDHSAQIWIRKDAIPSTTRFPLFRFYLDLGTTLVGSDVTLDTQAGTLNWRLYTNAPTAHTEALLESPDKLWWIIAIHIRNNTTGNTRLTLQVYPAVGFGTTPAAAYSPAATGSIVVGAVFVRLNAQSTTYLPPIETAGTAAVGTVITLADQAGGDGPIQFNYQLLWRFLRNAAGILSQVLESNVATQQVTVNNPIAQYAVNDLIQFRLDSAGNDLTYLTSPGDEASDAGTQVQVLDLPDVPGTNNLVPNPAMRTWSAGLPVNWTKVGTPTVTQDTVTHVRTAGSSARVQATADGQGLQSASFNVSMNGAQPYLGALASFWIISGKVRMELVLVYATGSIIIPIAPQYASSSELGKWVDLTIESYNAYTPNLITSAAIRIVAHQGAAEFYLDAAQVIESNGVLPFVEGSGGTRLWQLANERLRLYSGAFVTEALDAVDLYRLDGVTWAESQVVLGANVRVTDTGMSAAVYQTRVVSFTRDYVVNGAMSLVLSTKPEDLTGELAKPSRPRRVSLDDSATPPLQYNPPTAIVRHVVTGSNRSTQVLELDGALGHPTMAPLQWRYQRNAQAWTAWSTAALPVQVSISRDQYYHGNVTLEVMQADGQVGRFAWGFGAQNDALDENSGRTRRGQPSDDGDYNVRSTASTGLTAHGSVTDFGGRILRRFLGKVNIGDTDDVDGVPEGTTYQRTKATALTSGQVDMSKSGVVNRITRYINWLNSTPALSGSNTSGLTWNTGQTPATTIDSDVTTAKFHTNSSVSGAVVEYTLPSSVIIDTIRIYQAGSGSNATWAVEYYDGAGWVTLGTFNPSQPGWNVLTFGRTSMYNFRIRLTNTPGGSGPWTSQVEWIDSLGGHIGNHILYQSATEIHDRVINVIERSNPQFRPVTKISTGLAVNRALLKTNPGDANDADGLLDSATKRVIPFSVLRASDNALITRLGRGAAVVDVPAALLGAQKGKFLDLTFDDYSASESELNQSSTSVNVASVADSTSAVGVGGKVLEIGPGYCQLTGRTLLPINPTKLYRIRCRVKKTVDAASSTLYIGFLQYNSTGGTANSNGGALYCVFSNTALTVADGWIERTTYVRFADRAYGTSDAPSLDPANPAHFNTGTVQAVLYVLANYTTGGTTRIDYIQIDELDEAVSSRDANVAFGAVAKWPVNRHVEQIFNALDAQTKTFGASYDNTPEVNVLPLTWTLPGASSTVDRKLEVKATNITLTTCQTRAVISTGATSSSQSEGPHTTFGTQGTVGVTMTLGSSGGTCYWNLSNANTTLTTYIVNFTITTGTSGLYKVFVYKNTGTTDNVNWSLVGSKTYDVNITSLADTVSFDAAMGANWDIKLVWQSPGGSGAIGAQCVCGDTTYQKITAGTETALTPSGSSLLVQSREKA